MILAWDITKGANSARKDKMLAKTLKKKGRLPFSADFVEDKPGQFLKAQVAVTVNESFYSSTDQEQGCPAPGRQSGVISPHKRTLSAVQAFSFTSIPFKAQQDDTQVSGGLEHHRRASFSDDFKCQSISVKLQHPTLRFAHPKQPALDRLPLENFGLQKWPSNGEVGCLSDDDLIVIDLHTNMSKILQHRLMETEQNFLKKQGVKKQLLVMLLSQDREDLLTPRIHRTVRTSSASNATQVLGGSSYERKTA